MTRQATPTNILDALAPAPAPTYDLAAALAGPAPDLADDGGYDYAALGAIGPAIRLHVLAIKRAEQRMAENTVDAGLHLIAIKESVSHGDWLPLLNNVLGMSDDAAERMMNVARRFGSNSATLRNFSPSVLALLAAKSVPDSAVDAAIAAAEVSPVTVTAARAIIAAHRPARCRKCGRTLTDPDAIRAGVGACCAAKLVQGAAAGEAKGEAQALPEWVTTEPEDRRPYPEVFAELREKFGHHFNGDQDLAPAPNLAPPQGDSAPQGETHTDPRAAALARLAARLEGLREEMREIGEEFGKWVGTYQLPREVQRGIEKMQVQVQREQGEGWE